MGHYKSNLRDIEFTLFEVFGRSKVLGTGPYAEVDEDTARSILGEVERLATHELAESLLESDRTPPVYDPATHSVTMPESFKKSFQAYMDAEWWRMQIPAELGGTVVPASLRWAAEEWAADAPVSRFELIHTVGNDASCRVARKLGFELAQELPAYPPKFPEPGHLHVRPCPANS